MPLNPRQKKFVQEYLINSNATKAAKLAGYSEKTAYSIGQENLKKPEIAAAIEKAAAATAEKANITYERVMSELGRMAFAKKDSLIKLDALKTLAKHYGIIDAARFKHEKELRKDQGGDIEKLIQALPQQVYYEHPPARANGADKH